MSHRGRAVALAVAVGLVAGALPAVAATSDEPTRAEQIAQDRIAAEVVSQRLAGSSRNGATYGDVRAVGSVSLWSDLTAVARAWSEQQVRDGGLAHNRNLPDQVEGWRWLGENLGTITLGSSSRTLRADDVVDAADDLLQLWWESSSHRPTWMRPEADHIGVGVEVTSDLLNGSSVWRMTATVIFRDHDGSPLAAARLPDPPRTTASIVGLPPRSIVDTCGAAPSAGFVDVPTTGVFTSTIDCIADADITRGTTDRRYAPGSDVTLEQLAAFTNRMLAGAGVRIDADPGACRTSATLDADLDAMVAIGVLDRWDCDQWRTTVDRSTMARFVAGAIRYAGAGGQASPDAFMDDDGHPTEDAHDLLADLGVVVGDGGGWFLPGDDVTRGEMSRFLAAGLDVLLDA